MTSHSLVKLRRHYPAKDRTWLMGTVWEVVWYRRSIQRAVLRHDDGGSTSLLVHVPKGAFAIVSSAAEPQCRVCGCTESEACSEGCFWIEPWLCSGCVGKTPVVHEPPRRGGAEKK